MPPEPEFTAAVLGLGAIGLGLDLASPDNHIYTHVKACLRHPRFRLITGIDPKPERRREFEAFTGLRAYPSLEAAGLAPGPVDLCIIATPTPVRLEAVQAGLGLKPRLILVEKPLASTVAEGEAIMAACRGQEVRLAVNYFRYFAPGLQELWRLAGARDFGPLESAVCHYSGGLLNNASHFVSLLLQWCGPPLNVRPLGLARPLPSGDVNLAFALNLPHGPARFFPVAGDYSIGELDLFFRRGRLRLENYGEAAAMWAAGEDPFFPGYGRLLPLEPPPPAPDLSRYQYDVLTYLAQVLDARRDDALNAQNALETLRVCRQVSDVA
jgi:predicted dehydrogenase